MSVEKTDVAVIGGGYYGAFVANEIKEANPGLDVVVVEKENAPFTRASSTNQGQFHMGYMYSGDRALAEECVENIENFSATFASAVDGEVDSLYGIHVDSEISAEDYASFCEEVELPLEKVERPTNIFGDAVTTAFRSAEKTFNSGEIQRTLMERMTLNGIRLVTNFDAHAIRPTSSGVEVVSDEHSIEAERVFNATFADINALHDRSGLPINTSPLRYIFALRP
jgi:L-2-hydroxyglutarate oxidase LhgO